MSQNLQTFYVIWRGDEDDFMITRLDLDPVMMAPGKARLTNNQIVQMCWDAEYPDLPDNRFVGDNSASYEMIEIITGTDVRFVMQA